MGINRQGKRIELRKSNKKVKEHKKEFFNILKELEIIFPFVKNDVDKFDKYTDEELKEIMSQYTDIEIGNLEVLVMKGKLTNNGKNNN
jgi:hypothetical protein